jgi:hypothetical protein
MYRTKQRYDMKDNHALELEGSVEAAEAVRKVIRTAGIKGLDEDTAEELGLYKRLSFLISTMFSAYSAAYRIYGNISALLDEFGGKKHEIIKACNQIEGAWDKFTRFWKNGYMNTDSIKDSNYDTEILYHNIMRLSRIPESWQLGEPQRTDAPYDTAIITENGENRFYLKKSVKEDSSETVNEYWCVTKFDLKTKKQVIVENKIDKASALMVAKRMSANDSCNIYTASQVLEVKKEETIVTPFKAYSDGGDTGRNVKLLK